MMDALLHRGRLFAIGLAGVALIAELYAILN